MGPEGVRPRVGFRPNSPQNEDGTRIALRLDTEGRLRVLIGEMPTGGAVYWDPHDPEQALNNFDAGWAYLVDQCAAKGDVNGEPGSWCIEDRMAAGQLQPAHNGLGPWTGNGKWNWFAYYRDPIERDVPNPDPVTSTGGQYTLSVDPVTGQAILVPATDYTPWLLGGAAALMLIMAVSE